MFQVMRLDILARMDNLLRVLSIFSHFTRHNFHRIWKSIVFGESYATDFELFLKGFDWKDDR